MVQVWCGAVRGARYVCVLCAGACASVESWCGAGKLPVNNGILLHSLLLLHLNVICAIKCAGFDHLYKSEQ